MNIKILKRIEPFLGPIVRGALDGALSTLGIVVGAYGAPSQIIIAAGLSGGAAASISNTFAALSSEKTKMLINLNKIKSAMLKEDFEDTILHEMESKEVRTKGILDGIATIIGASFPVLPYLFLPPEQAIILAIALTSLLAFVLGIWMGKISERGLIMLGVKMALVAIVIALAATLIKQGIDASLYLIPLFSI